MIYEVPGSFIHSFVHSFIHPTRTSVTGAIAGAEESD